MEDVISKLYLRAVIIAPMSQGPSAMPMHSGIMPVQVYYSFRNPTQSGLEAPKPDPAQQRRVHRRLGEFRSKYQPRNRGHDHKQLWARAPTALDGTPNSGSTPAPTPWES
jgi:hypothetical protein